MENKINPNDYCIPLGFYDKMRRELHVQKQEELFSIVKKKTDEHYEHVNLDEELKKGNFAEVEDIKLAPDGGLLMYIKGDKYPVRSYPDVEAVKLTLYYKKLVPLFLRKIREGNVVKKVVMMLALLWNIDSLNFWLESLFNTTRAVLHDDYWSQPVKELKRVLDKVLPRNFVDAILLIVQYDAAYRHRLQDNLVHLDKTKIKGFWSTLKETQRIIDLIESKEKRGYTDMIKKWKMIKQAYTLAYFISPKLRKGVRQVLQDINLKEIEMSVEDIYHTNKIGEYNYRGMTDVERKKLI